MPRIVRLIPGPLPDQLVADLRQAEIFLAEPSAVTERRLADLSIPFRLITESEGVPATAVLLIPTSSLDDLVWVVDHLLGPGGCPWDQAQTHESLKKYLLEEAYEVLDAIDAGDDAVFCEELGDLLLQPILHAQIKRVAGGFDSSAVAAGIVDKLVRRHPHVFGDLSVADADEVLKNWDKIKQTEKSDQPKSVLAGVPKGMASLLRAHEVSKRAARNGFDWPAIEPVFDKLHEEESELRAALVDGTQEEIESEVGDLLFTVVNIARWSKVEPEEALRRMLNRFTERFMHMEEIADKPLRDLSPQEWDDLWNAAKVRV